MISDLGTDRVILDCPACGWKGDTTTTTPASHLGDRVRAWSCGGCGEVRMTWIPAGVTFEDLLRAVAADPAALDAPAVRLALQSEGAARMYTAIRGACPC